MAHMTDERAMSPVQVPVVGQSGGMSVLGVDAGAMERSQDQILTTRVGLQIPVDLSFDRWEHAGRHIARVLSASAWCLGDWLVYGQDRFTDRYRHAIEAAGLDYQTLRNYAWVARKFEPGRRRPLLSFQHHAEVASLPPEEQDRWLDRAERAEWSKSELRRRIRASRQGDGDTGPALPLPRVAVAVERVERWRAAAEQARCAFDQWIVQALDLAAGTVLDEEGRASDPT